jgi:GTP diphosphokinase / guanosine-3',5'-bis(diphosphate) 3'-diphosphatase
MAFVREEDVTLVLRALRFAAQRHREQRRKDAAASPYVNHLIAVAETLWCEGDIRDTATIVSGILHDTIEDTDTVPAEIESHFGNAVRAIVVEVTDDKGLPKHLRKRIQVETASRISHQAKGVKLADKICNLEDIMASPPTGWAEERKWEYVRWAKQVVDGLRGTNARLEARFDALYVQAERVLAGGGVGKADKQGPPGP